MKKTKCICQVNRRIGVVIPAYKVDNHLAELLENFGPEVDSIIVVDDACPQSSGAITARASRDPRVTLIVHEKNQGVGGAVKSGYEKALDLGMEIVVKIDGDGQMDPKFIPQLLEPILNSGCDYSKGNRFISVESLKGMPKLRIIGNLVLSFFSKISSGYWAIFDPNNGFTAITADKLRSLPLDKISNRYFFESDMLFRLGLTSSVIADVPMQSNYGKEKSNLSVVKVLFEFPYKHTRNGIKRVIYNYFIRDFSLASLELIGGISLVSFGLFFGITNYIHYRNLREFTPTGTQMIVAMTLLSGLQFILGFLAIDMRRNKSI